MVLSHRRMVPVPAQASVPQEIQDVGEGARVGLIDLGLGALRAGDCGELLVLNVEELRQAATGASKLIGLKLTTVTFRAPPVLVFHKRCSGRMRILTTLIKPGSVRAYLDGVGLPSRAPPIAPSRLDRQLEFDEPACSLRRVSADTPVPTRHAIAATRRFSMSSA